eukprot:6205718-Pleurochrysis_carterae.AAC.14
MLKCLTCTCVSFGDDVSYGPLRFHNFNVVRPPSATQHAELCNYTARGGKSTRPLLVTQLIPDGATLKSQGRSRHTQSQ